MDESGSVTSDDFVREKNFVAELANGFQNFNPNGIQMGLITFSTTADLTIKLNQFRSRAPFMNAVGSTGQKGEEKWFFRNMTVRVSISSSGGGSSSSSSSSRSSSSSSSDCSSSSSSSCCSRSRSRSRSSSRSSSRSRGSSSS